MKPTPIREAFVRNPAELCELWSSLVGEDGVGRRSVWLVMLEDGGRVVPMVVPIDDVPPAPNEQLLDGLRAVVDGLVGDHGVTSVALLVARPGSDALADDDLHWARGLAPLSPWPICLGTTGSVRIIAADDLIGSAQR